MEVRETAACGISEREFAIECDPEDLPHIYRILRFAQAEDGFIDEEFMEDLMSQMTYICGDEIAEDPDEDADMDNIRWEESESDTYDLHFSETLPFAGYTPASGGWFWPHGRWFHSCVWLLFP